jgi:hypothetical protein
MVQWRGGSSSQFLQFDMIQSNPTLQEEKLLCWTMVYDITQTDKRRNLTEHMPVETDVSPHIFSRLGLFVTHTKQVHSITHQRHNAFVQVAHLVKMKT